MLEDDWAFIVCFLQAFFLHKYIFINHPPGVGMQNNILGCKRMCGISLFYLDHQWMTIQFILKSVMYVTEQITSEHSAFGW